MINQYLEISGRKIRIDFGECYCHRKDILVSEFRCIEFTDAEKAVRFLLMRGYGLYGAIHLNGKHISLVATGLCSLPTHKVCNCPAKQVERVAQG